MGLDVGNGIYNLGVPPDGDFVYYSVVVEVLGISIVIFGVPLGDIGPFDDFFKKLGDIPWFWEVANEGDKTYLWVGVTESY